MLEMVDCLKCTFSGKVQQVLLTYISQADCMYGHSTSLLSLIASGHTCEEHS